MKHDENCEFHTCPACRELVNRIVANKGWYDRLTKEEQYAQVLKLAKEASEMTD